MRPWWFEDSQPWPLRPLYSVADEVSMRNLGLVESNVLSLSYGSIVRRDVESGLGLLPESFETYNRIERGDLVMRLTDLQNDKRSLRTGRVDEVGIITSAYTTLRFREMMDNRFAHYYLHALDMLKVFYQMGGGVRQSLRFDDIRRLPVPTPPRSVQMLLSDFLDRETDRIDTLIAAKRRLVELLAEKRTALITHAVTKGLDPTVPMKDSGIPWIGEIPAHWDVASVGALTDCLDGRRIPLSREERAEMQGPFPYYGASRVVDHVDGWIFDEDLLLLGEDGAQLENPDARVVQIARGRYWVNNHAHVLRPKRVTLEFLFFALDSIDRTTFVEGATRPKMTQESMNSIRIAVPPSHEQLAVSASLKAVDGTAAKVEAQLSSQLALLAEYRQALITAAVTGQLDEATLTGRQPADEAFGVEVPW